MTKRTVSAGVIGLVSYTLLYYSGYPPVIRATAAGLCCFCLYELACATDSIKNEALFTISILAAAFSCFWELPQEAVLAGICLAVSIPLFVLMMIFQPKVKLTGGLSFGILAFLVCGQLRSMIDVRGLPGGLHLLLICITECYATDVAAYLVGSKYGKRKLLPRVSPNKTLLGSVAGMGAAVAKSITAVTGRPATSVGAVARKPAIRAFMVAAPAAPGKLTEMVLFFHQP